MKISLKVEGFNRLASEERQITSSDRQNSDDSRRSGDHKVSTSDQVSKEHGKKDLVNELHVSSSSNQSIVVGSSNQSDQSQGRTSKSRDQTSQSKGTSRSLDQTDQSRGKNTKSQDHSESDQSEESIYKFHDNKAGLLGPKPYHKNGSSHKESIRISSESKKKKSASDKSESHDKHNNDKSEGDSVMNAKGDLTSNDSVSEASKHTSEPLIISTELLSASGGDGSNDMFAAGSSNGTASVISSGGQAKSEEKSVYSSSFDSLGECFIFLLLRILI